MNRRRRLVLLALLSAAWLAAGARSAMAIPRLAAPAAGVELTAGSQAAVEWEGAPPPGAEEWEAFLSLDGGRTYPLRITPHLDLSIRRFAPGSRRTMHWIRPRPTRSRTDEIAAPRTDDGKSAAPAPLRSGITRPSATAPAPLPVRLLTHRFNE